MTAINPRGAAYGLLAVALGLAAALGPPGWQGSPALHTLVESVAALLASFAGLVAILHFHANRRSKLLFLGVGLVGAGILDGYHAMATSELVLRSRPETPLVFWSWEASRLFLALAMMLCWWSWWQKGRRGGLDVAVRPSTVYRVAAAAVVGAVLFFTLAPLPPVYLGLGALGRPQELLPGAVFALALVGFLAAGAWRKDAVHHWIVVALLLSAACQLLYMPFSTRLFDEWFELAHLLKVASYAALAIGLSVSMFAQFRAAEAGIAQLALVNRELTHEVEQRRRAEEDLRGMAERLESRVADRTNDLEEQRLGALAIAAEAEAARARLAVSERRFRTLVTATSQIVWWTDPEGRVVGPLPSWQAYTGQSDEEIQGDGWGRALHPEDLPRTLEVWQKALRTRSLYEVEYRIRGRLGDFRYFLARGAPVLDERGEIGEWIGTCTDVTEVRRAALALQQSEARLQAILDNAPAVIYLKDPAGRYLLINRAFEELFGLGRHTAVGTTDYDHFPAEMADVFRENDRRVRNSGEPIQVEEEAPQAGDIHTYLSVKFPLFDDEGEIYAIGGISTDITELKRAQTEQARFAEELERSNADLQQFAYVASHDLQEPLRMVASFTQLLAERYADRLDQDARDFIGFAVEGATRMQALIQDLLSYSRVQTRGQDLAPVDLERVLASILHDFALSVEESGARVTHDPLPTVLADSNQLRQLLANLLSNALKFRRDGHPPRVHLAAARDGGAWRFTVRDNGIGMPPDEAGRIFTIFQRLHTRSDYPGTGIGLAICKKIVERHGGRIGVDTKPGEGSTFWFTLPDRTVGAMQEQPT